MRQSRNGICDLEKMTGKSDDEDFIGPAVPSALKKKQPKPVVPVVQKSNDSDDDDEEVGPAIPQAIIQAQKRVQRPASDDDEDIGPALPPSLMKKAVDEASAQPDTKSSEPEQQRKKRKGTGNPNVPVSGH